MPFTATKEIRINELVLNCPAAMEVLLNHGFHCVGCSLSAYETLEEGAKAHGYSDEEVGKIVDEINDAAREFEKRLTDSEKESAQKLANEREAAAKEAAEKAEAIWLGKANFQRDLPAGGNPAGFTPPKVKLGKEAAEAKGQSAREAAGAKESAKGKATGKKKGKKKKS